MVFLYYHDLIPIGITMAAFMLVPVIHRMLIPSMYSSVLEFLYEGDVKKTQNSSIIRILYVIGLTLLLYRVCRLTPAQIYLGVLCACILNVWPPIVQYRLYLCINNRDKLICFLSYVGFVIFSVTISVTTVRYLAPMLFDDVQVYLISNDGMGIILAFLSYVIPFSFETALAKATRVHTNADIDAYHEDLKIINTQLYFYEHVTSNYYYEMDRICQENDLNIELLKTIVLLEHIHRGKWYYKIGEWLVCKLIPLFAIKRDFSVGIAQIKISTAKDLLQKSPTKFTSKLVDTEFNLEVCAMLLKKLKADYHQLQDTELYTDEFDYIAMNYLCGHWVSNNRNTLIYSAVLRSRCNGCSFYH